MQALWNDRTRGLSEMERKARDEFTWAAGRLMSQLHARNSRHPFLPKSAFANSKLNDMQFLSEVKQALRKGDFLEDEDARIWKILT